MNDSLAKMLPMISYWPSIRSYEGT